MRSTLALAAVALAAVSTACAPQRRDVQVNFTFAGGQSCQAVGVATIEIDISGEILEPNQFACVSSGGQVNTGVDLGRFITGGYQIEITGFDANNNVTYQTQQIIDVVSSQDPNVFNIDVAAFTGQGGGQGALTLLWTFDGQSCAQAGVSTVLVDIDGTPVTDYNNNPALPCSQEGTDGVSIEPIDVGTHSVSISATGSNSVSYADALSVNIAENINTTLSPNLTSGGTDGGAPDGGSPDGGSGDAGSPDGGSTGTATAEISWSFAGMDCTDAQVDTVTAYLDGASVGSSACSTSGTSGGTFTGIAPGTHTVSIIAVRGSGASAELVYATSGAGTAAQFVAGTTTHLVLGAAATSPGSGGATLTLSFPDGGPSCSGSSSTTVSYTLTSPSGVAQAPASFTCGAGGASAITICDPGTSDCSGTGLAAGVWTISASTAGYAASQSFPVPNDAVDATAINFTAN